jgi:hypothetical protein
MEATPPRALGRRGDEYIAGCITAISTAMVMKRNVGRAED